MHHKLNQLLTEVSRGVVLVSWLWGLWKIFSQVLNSINSPKYMKASSSDIRCACCILGQKSPFEGLLNCGANFPRKSYGLVLKCFLLQKSRYLSLISANKQLFYFKSIGKG